MTEIPDQYQELWQQATVELDAACLELNDANRRFQVALHAKLALKEVIWKSQA